MHFFLVGFSNIECLYTWMIGSSSDTSDSSIQILLHGDGVNEAGNKYDSARAVTINNYYEFWNVRHLLWFVSIKTIILLFFI